MGRPQVGGNRATNHTSGTGNPMTTAISLNSIVQSSRRVRDWSISTPECAVVCSQRWLSLLCLAATLVALRVSAQQADALGPGVRKYLRVSTPRVVLEHVEIIDGTGGPPTADRNISIEGGRITGITAGADQSPSDVTTILDLRGYSVMPGIVGMHEHLLYLARPNLAADNSLRGPAVMWKCPTRRLASIWRTASRPCAPLAASSPTRI